MGNKESKPENRLKRFSKFEHENIEAWSDSFYSVYPNECFMLKDLVRELKVYFPDSDVEPFSRHLFRAFTKNNEVGFHDFMKTYSYLVYGDKNKRLELIFKFYDSNNDNRLCKEDIQTVNNDLLLMLKDFYKPEFNLDDVIKDLFSEIKEDFIDFKKFKELDVKGTKAFRILFSIFELKNTEE